jgi:hypothetical protein
MEKNNIESVNDLILYNWLKYAGEELKKVEETTEYDALKTMVQNLYSTAYAPVLSNYFDYTYNKTISPLPEEINGGLIDEYHNGYRRTAMEFNSSLGDSLFNRFTFEESPYAMAILKGANGEDLTVNNKEVFDRSGKLIDNTGEYKVYVPIDSIKGNSEILSLPEDAIIVDDLTYVLDTHINDYK